MPEQELLLILLLLLKLLLPLLYCIMGNVLESSREQIRYRSCTAGVLVLGCAGRIHEYLARVLLNLMHRTAPWGNMGNASQELPTV